MEVSEKNQKNVYNFNSEKVHAQLIAYLKTYFEENGKDCKAVIGISGGKDSTVVAALCVEALGADRVIGVMMPNGVQKDISDSIRVCKHLGIQSLTINIESAYNAILTQIESSGKEVTNQAKCNLPPRLRMSTLYAVAQTVGGRVINTSNASERALGWFTKNGDNCGDCFPLLSLTCTEVIRLGLTLNIPEDLVIKKPSDGLVGVSDEEKFGFTYRELDCVLRDYEIEEGVSEETLDKIYAMVDKSSFKRVVPNAFVPTAESIYSGTGVHISLLSVMNFREGNSHLLLR